MYVRDETLPRRPEERIGKPSPTLHREYGIVDAWKGHRETTIAGRGRGCQKCPIVDVLYPSACTVSGVKHSWRLPVCASRMATLLKYHWRPSRRHLVCRDIFSRRLLLYISTHAYVKRTSNSCSESSMFC